MTETLREVDCDLCGSAEKILIKSEEGFPISRCRNCSLIYVNQIPNIEEGKVIGEYYEGSQAEIEANEWRYKDVSKYLVAEINKFHEQKGALLDVGCGYGFFLLEAKRNGWQVFGTELSHIAVNYAREKQNLPDVYFSDLSDIKFSVDKFDAINLTNVLEHVPSPTIILENCASKMANGGVLLIRVPNMDFHNLKEKFKSIINFFGLGRGGEMAYLSTVPPLHLIGYTSRTLDKYFAKVGLETVEVKPSKLSAVANRNIVLRLFDAFVRGLYAVSFRRINLSPTVLAIAVKKA